MNANPLHPGGALLFSLRLGLSPTSEPLRPEHNQASD